MSFYTEIKRRNVICVGAAYAIVTWLLIQVAATAFPLFGLDSWMHIVVFLLVTGGIPAIELAWALELTATGLQRDDGNDPELSISTSAARRLDRTISGCDLCFRPAPSTGLPRLVEPGPITNNNQGNKGETICFYVI